MEYTQAWSTIGAKSITGKGGGRSVPWVCCQSWSTMQVGLEATRRFQQKPSRSSCRRDECASLARMLVYCGQRWSCCDDQLGRGNTYLDCSRSDRFTTRIHGAEQSGTNKAGAGPIFRARVCVSRTTRRPAQSALWDGDGLCLLSKRLERGRFVWPKAESGTVSLTKAQLSMLIEGIDWRRPERTTAPQLAS